MLSGRYVGWSYYGVGEQAVDIFIVCGCLISSGNALLPSPQIIGLRKHYFYSKWNIFDFLILIVSIVDLIVELSLPEETSTFSPAVLRLVRVLRFVRVGRVLRLVKVGCEEGGKRGERGRG